MYDLARVSWAGSLGYIQTQHNTSAQQARDVLQMIYMV